MHIVGAGALGTLWALRLKAAGLSPTLLVRSAPTAAAMRLRVINEHSDGSAEEHSARVESAGAAGAPISTLIVATKAFDARAAVRILVPRIDPTSAVILLCNGALALADDLCADLPRTARLYAATTTHGANVVAAGAAEREVRHAGFGATWVGPLRAHDHELPDEGVLEPLRRCGLGAQPESADATRARLWHKLAASATINPLTARWECRNGEALSTPERRAYAHAVCAEMAACGPPDGVTADTLRAFVETTVEHSAANISSMLADVRAGRRTEIEQFNGWIARRADARGVACPHTRAGAEWIRREVSASHPPRRHTTRTI